MRGCWSDLLNFFTGLGLFNLGRIERHECWLSLSKSGETGWLFLSFLLIYADLTLLVSDDSGSGSQKQGFQLFLLLLLSAISCSDWSTFWLILLLLELLFPQFLYLVLPILASCLGGLTCFYTCNISRWLIRISCSIGTC